MPQQTVAGGPASIRGFIYQILWCLLRSLRVQVGEIDLSGNEEANEAWLVLEPAGGGGDVRFEDSTVYVEQLKTRVDEGTWSLQSIISDVLPDLFLAVNPSDGRPQRYRIVTEGRMGGWSSVADFFRSLQSIPVGDDPVLSLDDVSLLRFQRNTRVYGDRQPFFPLAQYTRRTLFLRIAEVLRQRPAIARLQLDELAFHQRLWRLLANFEFIAEQGFSAIRNEIDRLLLAVVNRREDIPEKRQSLAMSLLEMATTGSANFDPRTFLSEQGVSATPLTEWYKLRCAAQQELRKIQRKIRFDSTLDVRTEFTQSLYQEWKITNRPFLITGESGSGKTWALMALAELAAADDAPVVWVDASGDAERDCQKAADHFWLDIREGNEEPLRLRQLARRLADVLPIFSAPRLRIFFDNVPTHAEAIQLLQEAWDDLGIQVFLSCPQHVADSLAHDREFATHLRTCRDWSWEELHEYLERRTGSDWSQIPDDIRDTLRRPLLARIYADDLFDESWRPTNEYELYHRVWKRLSTGSQSDFPFDAAYLEKLVSTLLTDAPYPWTIQQCIEAGLDASTVRRLERLGWLERTSDDRVRVFHDRLLNWAVAESLYAALRNGQMQEPEIVAHISKMTRGEHQKHRVNLGYVAMDFAWLVAGDPASHTSCIPALLAMLEQVYSPRSETLYTQTVRTLGSRIAESLFLRLQTFDGLRWVMNALLDALVDLGGERCPEFASRMFASNERFALKILRRFPCPRHLDRIWSIHVSAFVDPARWLEEDEDQGQLHKDSFGALKQAAQGQSDWLVRTIRTANNETAPVHDLGWLVAFQNDGGATWLRCKADLLAKVASSHVRVIAENIKLFRDQEEIPWLVSHVPSQTLGVGSTALLALVRVDPDRAVQCLRSLDETELRLTGTWFLGELFLLRPEAILAQLKLWLLGVDNPWAIALSLAAIANHLSLEIWNLLLDDLANRLAAPTGNDPDVRYLELRFLARIHSPEFLDLLVARRESPFETALVTYLLKLGPRRGVDENGLSRRSGLAVLRTIGGTGFSQVIHEYLRSESRFGRLDALAWAPRLPNAETCSILSNVIASEELWEQRHPIEQNDAMEALAIHGQWFDVAIGIVRWGLQTESTLTEDRLAPGELPDQELEPIRQALQSTPTAGTILALGFCGRSNDLDLIHALFKKGELPSEIAHAIIIALRLLGDTSEVGTQFVIDQLQSGTHAFSAVNMLFAAGTPLAWKALFRHLQQHFDHIVALNLINLSEHAADVVELVRSELPRCQMFGEGELRSLLIREIRSPEYRQRLLSDRWLRDKLHRDAVAAEGSFWYVGSKVEVIRCLAEFDANAAFDAAWTALTTEHWHDRERYPNLLMQIDATRAPKLLLNRLSVEPWQLIRYVIARALSRTILLHDFKALLKSGDVRQRIAACYAAGFAENGIEIRADLVEALHDSADEVVRAATNALLQLSERDLCWQLKERVLSATEPVEKWLYLDHLVEAIDPGVPFEPLPALLENLGCGISPLIFDRFNDRLKERRKELLDRLKTRRIDRD